MAARQQVDGAEVLGGKEGRTPSAVLRACQWCGLIQALPGVQGTQVAALSVRCARCASRLPGPVAAWRSGAVAALCVAALLLYPSAMALPVLEISRFGHTSRTTIWSGTVELIRDGHLAVGLIVLVCSIVIPLLKLAGMLAIVAPGAVHALAGAAGVSRPARAWTRRHRLFATRLIDWLGRWGMVDVLLVAVLVAAVKLGDLMTVHAGPGAAAFAAVVALSLFASAIFDPHAIYRERSA